MFDPDEMPEWLAGLWPPKKYGSSFLTAINDDDCAVIKFGSSCLIATMDFLNSHPIVMELGIGSWETLGRLTVASNLSDLCGTGAKPAAMLIGVTMPYNSKTVHFKQLMMGVKKETERYKIPVIGGDSKLGKKFSIVGLALGQSPSFKNLFLKKGAKPEDLIWVSGNVGSCAAAVVGLNQQFKNTKWIKWAKNILSKPDVPFKKSQFVAKSMFGHGGTDISDGIGVSINNICDKSKTGAIIYADQIPFSSEILTVAEKNCFLPWAFSFASGGDFQFLVTTSPKNENKMRKAGFYHIGKITSDNNRILVSNGCNYNLPMKGHRDSRKLSFYQEIIRLTKEVCNDKSN